MGSRFLRLVIAIFLSLALLAVEAADKTYYEILELDKDATLSDVKKSYRRLAMDTHPDRNKGREEEATLEFREVSEAYEVLSDKDRRREYDSMLRSGGAGRSARFEWGGRHGGARRRPRDPFAQFNDLFKNDPFFADAFQNLDDLFDKTFQGSGDGESVDRKGGGGLGSFMEKKIMDAFGGKLNFNVQTNMNGRRSSSTFSRSSGGRDSRTGSRGTYTSKSTKTIIENGRRITVQSLEKDGNRIEEKFDGTIIIERKINGVLQKDVGRIAGEF
mmetsp:Transcript_41850/g.126903  ORF Transcript_41850/g.126903 Transcript_41850/m.126903 type:complete len:273 (-) Transcript_41850:151-969(-)